MTCVDGAILGMLIGWVAFALGFILADFLLTIIEEQQ